MWGPEVAAGLAAVAAVGPASRPPSKSKLRTPSGSSIRERERFFFFFFLGDWLMN